LPAETTLWNRCIRDLQAELPEQQFNTWIRPLQAVEDEGRLRLLAPNRFVVDWLQEHYIQRILEIIDSSDSNTELVVEVGSRQGAVPAQERSPRTMPGMPPPDRGPAAWAQAPVTVAGGLPFLINVLSRLDFGPWLEGAPERTGWGVARRVLTRALTHADIPEADPAWALAIGDGGLGDSLVVERAADAWYAACGVWLRRFADIDIETARDVVRREGRPATGRRPRPSSEAAPTWRRRAAAVRR